MWYARLMSHLFLVFEVKIISCPDACFSVFPVQSEFTVGRRFSEFIRYASVYKAKRVSQCPDHYLKIN